MSPRGDSTHRSLADDVSAVSNAKALSFMLRSSASVSDPEPGSSDSPMGMSTYDCDVLRKSMIASPRWGPW